METSRLRSEARAPGRLRRTALTSAALVVVAASAWGAINTPVFHATDVRVSGAERLSRAEILERAGIVPTTNVVRMSAGTISERLESSPWVAKATVTRELPHTVSIFIRERRPVAAMRSGSGWVLLAEDATVLAARVRRPGLPVVDAPHAGEGRRAMRHSTVTPGARVAFARPLVAVLARIPAGIRVSRITRSGDVGVEFDLAGGGHVRYGEAADTARKNAAIAAVLRWARREGRTVRTVDVRVPEAPSATLMAAPPDA